MEEQLRHGNKIRRVTSCELAITKIKQGMGNREKNRGIMGNEESLKPGILKPGILKPGILKPGISITWKTKTRNL